MLIGEGQDPGTCDDAGAQSKDKTLKITETLENNRENVSNLDRQGKEKTNVLSETFSLPEVTNKEFLLYLQYLYILNFL